MSEFLIVYPDELYHHGIKGQKWGVRRFQNPDGSYTNAGKARYAEDIKKERKSKSSKKERDYSKVFEREIKTKNGKISTAEDVSKHATNIARNVRDISSYVDKIRSSKTRLDFQREASKLSNEELNKRINRMQLENRYADLNTDRIDAGRSRVTSVSDTALTALEITGAAVGIASAIVSIKRGK